MGNLLPKQKISKPTPSLPTEEVVNNTLQEAAPEEVNLFTEVKSIVLDYVGLDVENTQHFTLFGRNFPKYYELHKIATQIFWSQLKPEEMDVVFKKAETLAKEDSTFLRTHIPELTGPNGEKLYHIYFLQLLAMLNYFNPRKMRRHEQNWGAVEIFAPYLSKSEVHKQLTERFPPEGNETKERMDSYYTALTTFGEGILSSSSIAEKNAHLKKYKETLTAIVKRGYNTGLLFDPEIFIRAREYFMSNDERFGGWDGEESGFFWHEGYAALQRLAAVGDALVIKEGILQVCGHLKRLPSTRSLKYKFISPEIANDYYSNDASLIDDTGGTLMASMEGHKHNPIAKVNLCGAVGFEDVCRAKETTLQAFLKPPENQPENGMKRR